MAATPERTDICLTEYRSRDFGLRLGDFMVRPEARAKESNNQKVDFVSAESLLDPSIAPDSVFDFIMAQHQRLLHPEHPLTRFSY